MYEFYRVPALALLTVLLVVFGLLYIQARTTRRLLWLVGWSMVVFRLVIELAGGQGPGWLHAISNASMVLAAVMFLGSMSPLHFERWPKVLYVYVFAAPLLIGSILVSLDPHPGQLGHAVYLLLALVAVCVAVLWNRRRNLLPVWFTIPFAVLLGGFCLWLTYRGEYGFVLFIAQAACNLITALLILASYRRVTPGVVFTSAGFLIWSTPAVLDALAPTTDLSMTIVGRTINLVKVVTALGMVLLVLEDELTQNQAAKERDHRARVELERYAGIDFAAFSSVNIESAYQHACEAVAQSSRFSHAVLFLRNVENTFRLAAHAGIDKELVTALEALGRRVTPERARALVKTENVVVELGGTLQVDLRSLFVHGDDLERLQYTRAHVVPWRNSKGVLDAAMLLSGLKEPHIPLQADDLLPIELLVSRLSAMREHDDLAQRFAQSEKLAGLGQLAAGVAHELGNPLTVVIGYAELLEEVLDGHSAHPSVAVIRSESKRMRKIIDSMLRLGKSWPVEYSAVSLNEVVRDVRHLKKEEFARRDIQFEVQVAEDMPLIRANRNQLQQVVLHMLDNALNAFDAYVGREEKRVKLDLSYSKGTVRILMTDNGAGFPDPQRAFDPFTTSRQPGVRMGLGLSLCYAVVREHGGEITVHNLQPHGGALMVDLPIAGPVYRPSVAMASPSVDSPGSRR